MGAGRLIAATAPGFVLVDRLARCIGRQALVHPHHVSLKPPSRRAPPDVSEGGLRDIDHWIGVTLAPGEAVQYLERLLHDASAAGHMTTTAETPTKARPAESGPTTANDIRQMAIAAAVYSGLTGLAYWRPSEGRRALGIFFAVMGLAWNGSLTAKAPEQFPMLARRAPWGWYRRAGLALTEPASRAFGVVMTAGETAVAAAILSPDPAARLGLLAVAAFSLGIMPLGIYTLGNPILASGALYLARRSWPTAAFSRRPPR